MKKIKKLLAVILAVTVITSVSATSLGAYAAENNSSAVLADTEQDATLQAVSDKLDSTSDYLLTLPAPSVGSFGGEWLVIGLARNNTISESFVSGYRTNIESFVEEVGSSKLSSTKSTDNSRVILALSSLGIDARNIAGYDLTEPYADLEYIEGQGLNGPVFTLIALDTFNYEIPVDSTVSEQTTREKLIDYILENAVENGGWTFWGTTADPDMTGMAIQALAPYYNKNEKVKAAVDKALDVLSDMQDENGGYASWGTVNSESCAQVITALASLGIDPSKDSRFIKNNKSVVDALLSFGCENGFMHTADSGYNQMATEQAFYALVSYKRVASGNTSLYNMSDVEPKSVKYDINGDGKIDVNDATLIQKFVSKFAEPTLSQSVRADLDDNGSITVRDATIIQKYISAA